MVGGGSGGHVTPLKAVAKEIQKNHPDVQIEVITDRRFYSDAQKIFNDISTIRLKKIYSGKLRRYNGKSFFWHITHFPTLLKNILDIFALAIGFIQSFVHILAKRPDVVFAKGGSVSVPIGVMAHVLRVPLVIHDSDTHPGLASRLLSRWARVIATGMPTEYYDYPKKKTVYTGIPVGDKYEPIGGSQQSTLKHQIGFERNDPLLLITGGGTGASTLNSIVSRVGEGFLERGWQIIQVTGRGKSADVRDERNRLSKTQQKRWQIVEFVDLTPYVLAADIVISRTGATAMQEFANSKKTVITIPSRFLTGGHQLKNAKMFEEAGAAVVLDEQQLELNPEMLISTTESLVKDSDQAKKYAANLFHNFARPQAAADLATAIVHVAEKRVR